MATLDQVLSQMAAAGMPPLPPGHPVPTGKIVRYGPKKKAWYVLHEYPARNGRRYLFGSFGRWQGLDNGAIKIESDTSFMDPAEAERLQRSRAALEAQAQAKRAQRARFAANRARSQWTSARAQGESPYLARKGVEPEKGLRFATDGTLLVPMIRYDVTEEQERDPADDAPRRLVGLQKIAPDGTKLFNRGMLKTGAACRLGKAPSDGDLVCIVEGVATGLSVRQALERRHAVFVAFDAGNLLSVARVVRGLYPTSPVLFCADDDAYLEARMNALLRDQYGVAQSVRVPPAALELDGRDGPLTLNASWECDADGVPLITGAVAQAGRLYAFAMENAGRKLAHAAAREIGNARVCYPAFRNRMLDYEPDAARVTDFNDLHAAEGLQAVAIQLGGEIAKFGADESAEAGAAADGKPAAGGGKKGDKPPPPEPEWELFWQIVNRFTYVYPTDTAYDHVLGDFVKIEHMRLKFSPRYVQMWLGSTKRRDVDLPHVVFDPSDKTPAPKLNLFRGLAVPPAEEAAGCENLLRLLFLLCNEDDKVFDWVLKWLAYPLQHLGAKMQTALVFSGKEGAGKNLFFGVVRGIYGAHGGVITQRQLENDFNLWLSAKLFLVANEVVTRTEMRHHVGFLKNLITEPEIWINRKNKDERCEANHCNLVFFSNELQPLQISPDDRRYLVVKTPGAPSTDEGRALYKDAVAETEADGAAALHRYLLDLDLGDFGPHTKPIMTGAKRDLIELGLNGAQLFWQDIHDAEVPLPYCPARVVDVYRCYQVWARRNGDKMPSRVNAFIPNFMSMNGVRRMRPRVPKIDFVGGEIVADSKREAQAKVLVMGEPPPGADIDEWVRGGVIEFAKAAAEYCGGDR